ncbi:MAG: glycosyltransferase family 4 protein [Gammaproteobacteria bacterium]
MPHVIGRAAACLEHKSAVVPAYGRPVRLCVINSHPIQYFAPLYAYVSQDVALELTAIYCSDFSLRMATDPGFNQVVAWDIDLLAGYKSVFVAGNHERTPRGFWSLVCPQLWSEIRSDRYDVVLLHGYSYAATVIAFLAARTKNIPILMRSETHLGLRRNEFKRFVRDSALRIAYRFVDGFLAIGSNNRDYYRALGVPSHKIFDVPYAVDNDRFIAPSSGDHRASLRRKYRLPDDQPIVLYASKFIQRKHPDDLIRAMAMLRDRGCIAALFMVGSGVMEQELRDLARSLGLTNVTFAGFVNQREMPDIYSVADVFVLPSDNEPWGLVINEVMCAGLPVVVSDEVGCVADLVKDGVNGYHAKVGDPLSLAKAVGKLLASRDARAAMGAASLRIIRQWSYDQCLQGMKAAVAAVVR